MDAVKEHDRLVLVDVDGDRFRVAAPNGFAKDWLENRLLTPIQRTLCGIAGQPVEITFYAANSPAVDSTQE